jgi:transcriptional regulator with XRE-family HTH domain
MAARLLRQEAGLSQEEVARRGNVSLTHITRLENGRSNPTYKILERIATGLGVSSAELFSLAGVLARCAETL